MSAKKRRIDQLQIVSPCSTNWDRMPGDEKKRYCAECDKFVYDFSRMTRRQVEAIVSINKGRMCARITRRPDGSMLTLETPTVHPAVTRRASPAVNAVLAAILGLSVPAAPLNADVSAAYGAVRSDTDNNDDKIPHGGGEALIGGRVFDPQGTAISSAVVKLISDEGAELETNTSDEGEFTFAQVPYGAYIMLVKAQDFYTHVNSNIIVDTPYDTRLEVTMKEGPTPVMGGAMFAPFSLLDLHKHSDLIAIAQIGQSITTETVDGEYRLKMDLRVSEQLKGENSREVITLYYWNYYGPTKLKPGDRLLVFLKHHKSEDGERLDGYMTTGMEESLKKLDDGALAVYRQRSVELTEIFQRANPDPAEIVEWLVRCIEEPATREGGIPTLSQSLYALQSYRERENTAQSESKETEEVSGQQENNEEQSDEESSDFDEVEWERERLKLAAALTQDQKVRLANALFGVTELSGADTALVGLIKQLGDDRLKPYLISQLRLVADRPPVFAEALAWNLAEATNDEDLKRLAIDYRYAAEYDESEYEGASALQNPSQNQGADGLTVAAIKRSAMLKDFLKLVQYKTNGEKALYGASNQ